MSFHVVKSAPGVHQPKAVFQRGETEETNDYPVKKQHSLFPKLSKRHVFLAFHAHMALCNTFLMFLNGLLIFTFKCLIQLRRDLPALASCKELVELQAFLIRICSLLHVCKIAIWGLC